MTEPAWYPEARRLYAELGSYAAVGAALGYCPSTVWKALNSDARRRYYQRDANYPGRREAKNAESRKLTDVQCLDCPTFLTRGSIRKGSKRCWPCELERRIASAEPTRAQIVEWWAAGRTLAQISEALGWTKNHLSVEIARMRDAGYSLPYRYKPRTREHFKHPEQVAA